MTKEEFQVLHDRLADIGCIVEGFKIGILANPNGNKSQRDAMLQMSEFILIRVKEQKGKLQKYL